MQTDRQTYRKTDRRTDRQTDRQAFRQKGRQTERIETERIQTDGQTVRSKQTDRPKQTWRMWCGLS